MVRFEEKIIIYALEQRPLTIIGSCFCLHIFSVNTRKYNDFSSLKFESPNAKFNTKDPKWDNFQMIKGQKNFKGRGCDTFPSSGYDDTLWALGVNDNNDEKECVVCIAIDTCTL